MTIINKTATFTRRCFIATLNIHIEGKLSMRFSPSVAINPTWTSPISGLQRIVNWCTLVIALNYALTFHQAHWLNAQAIAFCISPGSLTCLHQWTTRLHQLRFRRCDAVHFWRGILLAGAQLLSRLRLFAHHEAHHLYQLRNVSASPVKPGAGVNVKCHRHYRQSLTLFAVC